MQAKTLEDLARKGGARDVQSLLIVYGDQRTEDDPRRTCLDCIVAGVLSDRSGRPNEKRRGEIAAFLARQGVYAGLPKAVPQDVVKEFRDTIAELTKQVAELKEAVVQLSRPAKIVLKKE